MDTWAARAHSPDWLRKKVWTPKLFARGWRVGAELGAQGAEGVVADPVAETAEEFFVAGSAAAVGGAIGAEVLGRLVVALVFLGAGVELDFVVGEVVPGVVLEFPSPTADTVIVCDAQLHCCFLRPRSTPICVVS